ncbi:hypothetical protein BH11PSE2_BH11PSE2_18900 [soil metagenome]
MRTLAGVALAALLAGTVAAQPAVNRPLEEKRLSASTLVREDIFAGFMQNDMKALARGEASVETLLTQRPEEKAGLLSWRAGATIYRAVLAKEAGRNREYKTLYGKAIADLDAAAALKSPDGAVPAVSGGVMVLFGDRLKADQAAAWQRAYVNYQQIYAGQGQILDKLPVHHRGEVLGGLVTSAQRTGHTAEMNAGLDRMLVLLKDTPYEATAKQWKADPASAGKTNLACKNCHDAGRLEPSLKALSKAPA